MISSPVSLIGHKGNYKDGNSRNEIIYFFDIHFQGTHISFEQHPVDSNKHGTIITDCSLQPIANILLTTLARRYCHLLLRIYCM